MNDETTNAAPAAGDVLVVVSKLKSYIRSKSDMNTSGAVAARLSEIVRGLCDKAIERAKADNRKTVMDRDFDTPPAAM
jgi:histone H3/H4